MRIVVLSDSHKNVGRLFAAVERHLDNADLYIFLGDGEDDFDEEIRQGLEQKLYAILNRQLYSQYKTAPTEEEREQARQEYLARRGVPQSYRWTTPPW